jgi:hypothetical protein
MPGVDTDAGVPKVDGDMTVFLARRRNRQVPAMFVDAAHGLDGVRDQVQDDLLQRHPSPSTAGSSIARSARLSRL